MAEVRELVVPARVVRLSGRGGVTLLSVAFFLVLTVALPLVVIDRSSPTSTLNIVLAWVVCALCASRLSLLMLTGRPLLLTMAFHVYGYAFLGLASLAQISAKTYPTVEFNYTDQLVTQALVVVIVGVLSFELGGALFRGRWATERPPVLARLTFSRGRALFLGAFGMAFVAMSVAQIGLRPYFTSRQGAAAAQAGRSGDVGVYDLADKAGMLLKATAAQVPTYMALVALLYLFRHRHRDRTDPWTSGTVLLAICVLAVGNVVVNNPVSNSRFWFVTVLLGVTCVYFPWRTAAGVRTMVAGSTFSLLFAFTTLDAFRVNHSDFHYSGFRRSLLTDESYTGFQSIVKGLVYVGVNGHTHGRQTLGAFLPFIPSRFWLNKPGDTGHVIDPVYNRTATLWTEEHIEFGMISLVVGFLVVGMVSRWVEVSLARSTGALVVLLPILCGFMFMVTRGSLVNAVGAMYPVLACVVFLAVPESRRRRRDVDRPMILLSGQDPQRTEPDGHVQWREQGQQTHGAHRSVQHGADGTHDQPA